jgi:hypothetical protein
VSDLDDQYENLLEAVRAIGTPEAARVVRKEPSRTKADADYICPTTREIEEVLQELLALGEIKAPHGFACPSGASKQKALEALESVDPYGRVSERATLLRLLRAKKATVPDGATTADLVRIAMKAGCFGQENKKRET